MSCDTQCHGCAFKPGATAHQESNNRLKGAIAAIGGIPFHCHEKLGWTPEKDGYPGGQGAIERACEDLRAAPKLIHDSPDLAEAFADCTPNGLPPEIFADARKLLGKRPMCGGWRAAVADLARQGWFRDREHRTALRRDANAALLLLESLVGEKDAERRKSAIASIGDHCRALVARLRERGVRTGVFS